MAAFDGQLWQHCGHSGHLPCICAAVTARCIVVTLWQCISDDCHVTLCHRITASIIVRFFARQHKICLCDFARQQGNTPVLLLRFRLSVFSRIVFHQLFQFGTHCFSPFSINNQKRQYSKEGFPLVSMTSMAAKTANALLFVHAADHGVHQTVFSKVNTRRPFIRSDGRRHCNE